MQRYNFFRFSLHLSKKFHYFASKSECKPLWPLTPPVRKTHTTILLLPLVRYGESTKQGANFLFIIEV